MRASYSLNENPARGWILGRRIGVRKERTDMGQTLGAKDRDELLRIMRQEHTAFPVEIMLWDGRIVRGEKMADNELIVRAAPVISVSDIDEMLKTGGEWTRRPMGARETKAITWSIKESAE